MYIYAIEFVSIKYDVQLVDDAQSKYSLVHILLL